MHAWTTEFLLSRVLIKNPISGRTSWPAKAAKAAGEALFSATMSILRCLVFLQILLLRFFASDGNVEV